MKEYPIQSIGNNPSEEKWLSMMEASLGTPYSAEYLSLLARKGKLAAKKVDNVWYTTKSGLDTYMQRQMARAQIQNGSVPVSSLNDTFQAPAAAPLEKPVSVAAKFEAEPLKTIRSYKDDHREHEERLRRLAEARTQSAVERIVTEPDAPVPYFEMKPLKTVRSYKDDHAKHEENFQKQVKSAIAPHTVHQTSPSHLAQIEHALERALAKRTPSFTLPKVQAHLRSNLSKSATALALVSVLFFTLFPIPFVFSFFDKALSAVKEAVNDANTVMGFRPGTHENELLLLDKAGNISIMGHIATEGQLISTAPPGVAPIVVDSMSTVANLSADYIDGVSSKDFTLAFVTKNGGVTTEDVHLEGDVGVGETLTVKGAVKLLGSELAVLGNAEFAKILRVVGPAYFENMVEMRRNLNVAGSVVIGRGLQAEVGYFDELGVGGDFSVAGDTKLKDVTSTSLFADNLRAVVSTITSLIADDISVGALTATDVTTINATTTNSFITSLSATTATLENLFLTGASSIPSLTFVDAIGTSATTTNLFATRGAFDSLTVSGGATVSGDFTVGGDTATIGQLLSTRVPTLAHVFSPWPSGASNASDATIYINPATAAPDTNIFAAAVGGSVKFLVDAEGDIYAGNMILSGSVSQGETNIAGNLSVQDSTTLGDASSDLITLNGSLLALASTTLQNFTFANATGTNATTTNLFSNRITAGDIVSSGVILAANGSAGAPSYSFLNDADTGFRSGGVGNTWYSSNGADSWFFSGSYLGHAAGGGALLSGNSVSSPALTFGNDQNTGFYNPSEDVAGVTVGGAEVARFTSTGFQVTGSTTLQNFTFANATGTNATTTDLYVANTISGSVSGSAATLTNTRTIWGQNFNGSANVSGALSGATTGVFTGKLTGEFVAATGQVSANVANQTMLDFVGSSIGRLSVFGNNASTQGTLWFRSASSDGSLSTNALILTPTLATLPGGLTMNGAFSNTSSSNSYFTGNLGIGTTTPDTKLYVAGSSGSLLTLHKSSGVNQGKYTLGVVGAAANDFFVRNDVSGATPFLIDASGNVGIGTTTPQYKLSIVGGSLEIGAQNRVLDFTNGGTLNSRLGVAGSTGGLVTGSAQGDFVIENILNNKILFATNGDNVRMAIDNSGNVGIGITNPGAKLQVVGGAVLIGNTNSQTNSTLRVGRDDAMNAAMISSSNYDVDDTTPIFRARGGLSPTGNGIYSFLGETVSDVRTFSVDYTGAGYFAGNVGIGVTNPGRTLEVVSTVSGEYPFRIDGVQGAMEFQSSNVTKAIIGTGASFFNTGGIADGLLIRSEGVGIQFAPGGSGIAVATTMLPNGNVGIGSTNPQAKLHVLGANASALAPFTGTGFGNIPNITIANSNGTANNYTGISFSHDEAGSASAGIVAQIVSHSTGEGNLIFGTTNSSGSLAERMRITSAGNVGIGTTTSEGILSVKGSSGSTNYIRLMNDSTNNDVARITDCGTGLDSGILALKDGGTTKVNLVGDDDNVSCGFTYFNAGNVGIGTTGPSAKLHVMAGAPGEVARFQGTVADGRYVEIHHDEIRSHSSALYLNADGVNRVIAGGLLSTPEFFTVNGASAIIPATAGEGLTIYRRNSNSVTGLTISMDSGDDTVFNTTNGIYHFQVGGSDKMTINTNGNITFANYSAGNCCSDIAEFYPSSEPVEAADLMAVDPAGGATVLRKARGSGDTLIGVVSTNPALAIEDEHLFLAGGTDNYVVDPLKPVVALAGRVPVKISLENGPIEPGDHLTVSSTTPGYAAKLVGAGQSVGVALESSEGKDRVLIYVSLEYQGGETATSLAALTAAFDNQALRLDVFEQRIESVEQRLATLESVAFASTTANSTGLTISTLTPNFVASVLESVKATVVDGVTHFVQLAVDSLSTYALTVRDTFTIGSTEKPAGITVYDEDTGEPYCLKVKSGSQVSTPGRCGEPLALNEAESEPDNISEPSDPSDTTATSTDPSMGSASTTEDVIADDPSGGTASSTPETTEEDLAPNDEAADEAQTTEPAAESAPEGESGPDSTSSPQATDATISSNDSAPETATP